MLRCYYCGEDSVGCGEFVVDSRGDLKHIGPCCLALAHRISSTGDPEEVTHKYAVAQ